MKNLFLLSLFFAHSIANANILFFEDFESGLGQWDDSFQGNNAQIVSDPLQSGNNVLSFTKTLGNGDLFTSSSYTGNTDENYILSFDYLGTCGTDNCGGFIGISSNTVSDNHTWLAGTTTFWSDVTFLPDTGAWEHISITFNTNLSSLHLMLEDWIGFDGNAVAGDAYFDNILLTDANGAIPNVSNVPVPAAVWFFGSGLIGLIGIKKQGINIKIVKV